MRDVIEKQALRACDKRCTFVLLVAAVLFGAILSPRANGCEVTNVWLYVGETEDEATEHSYTTLTLCDVPEEYWFRIRWKAKDDSSPGAPGGDNDFHVEVHDVTKDISLWEEEHIEDEDPGDTQEEVIEVDSPAGALEEGVHTLVGEVKRRDVGEWVLSDDATVDVRDNDLGCTPQEQRKDTKLVCIAGCPKTGTHAWDNEHPGLGCDHEEYYCSAACISVINAYFGGSLSQDRIAFMVMGGSANELSHADLWEESEAEGALEWALDYATITEDDTPTFAEIKNYICQGRPMVAAHYVGFFYHDVVIDGCHTADGNDYIHVLDPDSGTENNEVWGVYSISKIWIPPANATGGSDEPQVSSDADGDGLMDFDEISRFNDSPYNFSWQDDDSDTDGKNDKEELADIVFGP